MHTTIKLTVDLACPNPAVLERLMMYSRSLSDDVLEKPQ